MSKQTYTYDYTVQLYDSPHQYVGDIEVRISYRVTDWGSPAVMYLRNGDPGHPAEPAEIDVIGVEMALREQEATAPDGSKVKITEWVDAWDWLYDHVSSLAEHHLVDEMVEDARDADVSARDDYLESQADERRLNARDL